MENSGYQLKTTTVFVMLIWFANLVIAQDTAQYNLDKKTRHEIGLNLSGMIRLTNADNRDTAGSYQQNYFLTYRYYFKKAALEQLWLQIMLNKILFTKLVRLMLCQKFRFKPEINISD